MKRRQLITAASAIAASAALSVRAQTTAKIAYGYTAVSDFASVFVAAEEGYFKQHGLDVELKFIPLNSAIPAAIQSDSLQIGGPTPTVFLQSVDGGLDHVVLAGGGVLSKTYTDLAAVARAGSNIRSPQDFLGKKVGVPGLGALLHVTFRQWLKNNGVDYRKVNFIEAPFPQHADLIRGGSIDAVITAGPFMARIVDSGTGYVASFYTTFLPDGLPTIVHVAKREWVKANPAAAKGFAQAVQEGAAFMRNPKNDGRLRAALVKYLRLPAPAVQKMQISPPGPMVSERQLNDWIQMMNGQQMLKTAPAAGQLLVK
ncbi:MAG: ABC transporter substrate-binding protein [Rhodoferax sp.]|uniref:ABC transporter substrate-binding protein n=1 Tax=Rhodoferax sp. TaxID=50421 RepID=UPI00260D04BA|nr:ABC transporter substrate-binding protein [Rhodoferax sp.]MDD5335423.1 ABC transporter substrate-binding protein [Rhodoferax sp.]